MQCSPFLHRELFWVRTPVYRRFRNRWTAYSLCQLTATAVSAVVYSHNQLFYLIFCEIIRLLFKIPAKHLFFTNVSAWSQFHHLRKMQQWFCVYRTLSTCFLLTVTAAQNILFCRCYHFFVCISLIICLHLHLSLSLLIPSPQLHLSYPPTAPAVTLQQLGMVTMVTHYHHHTGLLLSSPSLSSLPPLSEIRGSLPVFRSYPDLHNVKNDADAERGQAGWVSCLTEKWSADVRLSNWKKWKHGHWKGENVCVCLSM